MRDREEQLCAGNRRIELILTAIPMGVSPEEIRRVLGRAISASKCVQKTW